LLQVARFTARDMVSRCDVIEGCLSAAHAASEGTRRTNTEKYLVRCQRALDLASVNRTIMEQNTFYNHLRPHCPLDWK
jgi:hypothetical protein